MTSFGPMAHKERFASFVAQDKERGSAPRAGEAENLIRNQPRSTTQPSRQQQTKSHIKNQNGGKRVFNKSKPSRVTKKDSLIFRLS